MKDIFYRPDLGEERKHNSLKRFDDEIIAPKRNYYSEDEFEDPEEVIEEDPDTLEDIEEDIRQIIRVLDDLPLDLPFPRSLEKMLDDIEDIKKIEEEVRLIEIQRPEPLPVFPQVPNLDNPQFVPEEGPPVSLFPVDNEIEFETEPNLPIDIESKNSFVKDKKDMYRIFVGKLKLMLQQHMREVLYIAIKGEFSSYKDLYLDFLTKTEKVPDQFKHTADRITKGQIERDQKNRLLRKSFNIEQTVYHMTSNKATFEQRQRYYNTDYVDANDYLYTKENDELRKARKEYDAKYEKSMYNYYKYLNSSIKVTEEILQGFTSEARGKAILKKNGVDPAAGLKEEEALREKRVKDLEKKTEENKKKADEKLEKSVSQVVAAGKAENYEGTNFIPPMPGDITITGGGVPGTTQAGSGTYTADITADIMNKINEIRKGDFTNGEKIAKMAVLCNQMRGRGGRSPIYYDMGLYGAKAKILSKACYKSDCSSFSRGVLMYSMGIDIGGSTLDQVKKNRGGQWLYNPSQLQPGDLIYLKYVAGGSYKGHSVTMPNGTSLRVNHVMVYIGDNKVIHCTKGGGSNGIVLDELSTKWKTTAFAGILRI